MTPTIPLRIWPHDITEEQLDMILEAKATLDTDVQVIPSPAAPGGPGRVLAFGEIPPFFCESVIIGAANVDRVESIRAALKHLLTAPAGAPGSFTEEEWLGAVMGCNVRQVAA